MSGKVTQHFQQRKKGSRPAPTSKADPEQRKAAKSTPQGLGYTVSAKDEGYTVSAKDEEMLKQFDLNSAFGPCTGMSRKERWDRAQSFGLEPPQQVMTLLQRLGSGDAHHFDIWHNRV